MNNAKILLIDDHALFRSGLRMLLSSGLQMPELHEVSSVEEALLGSFKPQLILLDMVLGGLSGLDGIRILKHRWPDASMIVVSSQNDATTISQVLNKGVDAYLSKAEGAEEILRVIAGVLCREIQHEVAEKPVAITNAGIPDFSSRQLQVLDLLAKGYSNKMIARQLGLSENTVRWHVQTLLEMLQVNNRSDAAFFAREKGLVG